MSRSARLFDLLQLLRARSQPVSGGELARELGVSLRTLYRDIATLQGQGAHIVGEAGLGYVLAPGFVLPPLMFSQEEIEALVLGARWVAQRGDSGLEEAARHALSKIRDVLPAPLREELDGAGLLVPPSGWVEQSRIDIGLLRQVIRAGKVLRISYEDAAGAVSERMVWPFALAYFNHVHMLVAFCETRQDFRHFRTDRISAFALQEHRYPKRRQVLLAEWRKHMAEEGARKKAADRS